MVKRFFTLLELLLVIGIIALLSTMLLPALSLARSKAISIKCLGNEKQIGLALGMYIDQYNHTPTVKYTGLEIRYVDLLQEFIDQKSSPVFNCPADPTGGPISEADSVHISYGVNTYKSASLDNSFWYCLPISLVRRPSECIWLADSKETPSGTSSLSLCGSYTADPDSGYSKYVSWRHNEVKRQFNALFVDGHGSIMSLSQTPYRFWDIDGKWNGE